VKVTLHVDVFENSFSELRKNVSFEIGRRRVFLSNDQFARKISMYGKVIPEVKGRFLLPSQTVTQFLLLLLLFLWIHDSEI